MIRSAALCLACLIPVCRAQVDVLTAQYGLDRTSSNLRETVLTPGNVNSAHFGKLFSRKVDAPFYASPLIVTSFDVPGVGLRDLLIVATLGNTVYAFDADDPKADNPYWRVNLGKPLFVGGYYLGPTLGILSTPVIDRASNTIYVAGIVQSPSKDNGLYAFALDLATGALNFHSPARLTFTFPSGVTKKDAAVWIQRAALTLVKGVLYIATTNVLENGESRSQEGFLQAFQADDLAVRLASYETTPSGEGGALWQAGRGFAIDSEGNVLAAVDSGAYHPPQSFGISVTKFQCGTLTPLSWFTPANWSFLYKKNMDLSANGVMLIPGTHLAIAGGKPGVIYLLDHTNLGGLEAGQPNVPLQQFQASEGCGVKDCGQHLSTAFWPQEKEPFLYVWDVHDYLRAIPFDPTSQRFVEKKATIGKLLPSRSGGITVSSNGNVANTGIVWAITASKEPFTGLVAGTLRAFKANDITQELYNSGEKATRDTMGDFVKMTVPIVANGKVYVNSQSNIVPVYGLLPPADSR